MRPRRHHRDTSQCRVRLDLLNNELVRIREWMIELGVGIVTEHRVTDFRDGTVDMSSVYRGGEIVGEGRNFGGPSQQFA